LLGKPKRSKEEQGEYERFRERVKESEMDGGGIRSGG
jgi:hypothetical protein